jgi:hypothetical protein
MKPIYYIALLLLLALTSCFPKYKYQAGTFPDFPVNLEGFNSEYDDYNPAYPMTLSESFPLCFSSNRNRGGLDFDIIYKLLEIKFNRKTGILSVGENNDGWVADVFSENVNLNDALSIINTTHNEFGPYLIPQGHNWVKVGGGYQPFQHYIFLYATDESGNLEIKCTNNLTGQTYSDPVSVAFLNSARDDAYPTINRDSTIIYFCSNRDSGFDIYKTNLVNTVSLLADLSDPSPRNIIKDNILSSDYDDKCPYIVGDLMVFTSNRSGGYGGFDLYYSIFKNGNWSEPVNFGEKINTQYDEYRPIVKVFDYGFTNDFMIFSSNRPTGKGGFDLYFVGINKMTDISTANTDVK